MPDVRTDALQVVPATSLIPNMEAFQTMYKMAEILHSSGLIPETIKTPAAALAIIQKGVELGIPPMYSLSNIAVIKGKPSCNSELMLALVYRDHGDNAVQFVETTDNTCTIAYRRRTWTESRQYTYSMDDAKKAGVNVGTTWQKFPAPMLRARCISAVARLAFPDSIGGMHTPEELGAQVEVRDNEVVTVSYPNAGVKTVERATGVITEIKEVPNKAEFQPAPHVPLGQDEAPESTLLDLNKRITKFNERYHPAKPLPNVGKLTQSQVMRTNARLNELIKEAQAAEKATKVAAAEDAFPPLDRPAPQVDGAVAAPEADPTTGTLVFSVVSDEEEEAF